MSGLIPGQSPEGGPVLPPDWHELAPLIDAVLDAEPEQRAALIIELSEGSPARERALSDLVAECVRDVPLLDGLASEQFADLAHEDPGCLLPELLGDRYRMGRELGRGGMARVYLARDLKHNRDVAIKVIRPELSASLGHDRFLREIGIAARLRHPNIVPLYDSGEVGESLYFVMPYEEGPSLRERLTQEGAIPVADALNVLRDVARALAYAHDHGVVHRDVKPDNVMLSGGAAVVTDFGIAKALSAALTDVSGPPLTQSGSAIGTPAYMAPEQATGDPSTDHRADLYSFGCLGYELFTGQPPFAHDSMHLVIAAHLGTVPQPVNTLRAEVPPAVAELLARCLEKHPSARPQSAREVLDSLDGAATGGYATPVSVGAPVSRRSRAPRWAGLALTAGVAAAGVYLATRAGDSPPPITLAVLPINNISADSAIEFVAEGLGDDVAGVLLTVPGIQIQGRSSAWKYRGQLGVDVTEAGARLGADWVMTGAVRLQGGHWILSAQLERSADKANVWGESFDISPDQAAGAAQAIAARVVASLRLRFPKVIGAAPSLPANRRTENNEAYRLYLKGREMFSRRTVSVKESAELFRAAIRLDSLYAMAYSGLSVALALSPFYEGVPPRTIQDELVDAARRALDLDSTLAQPHVALGLASWFDHQWERAESEFKTALQLEPRNAEVRVQYARLLITMGRNRDALRQLRSARAEDPSSAVVLSWTAYAYYLEGQADSALIESQRALENDSSLSARDFGARVLLRHSRPAEALKLIASAPPWFWVKGYLLAKAGDPAAARRLLQEWDAAAAQPWYAETRRAFTYLGLGDTAQALSALERADARGENWALFAGPSDPLFAPIRRSAQFRALLRKVGLERQARTFHSRRRIQRHVGGRKPGCHTARHAPCSVL
jgi:eukaryotic-like serine/threonine-protein kinase